MHYPRRDQEGTLLHSGRANVDEPSFPTQLAENDVSSVFILAIEVCTANLQCVLDDAPA